MRIALTRALVSVFWITTAFYTLLAAIPFASKQFLEPQLVPAVTAFAEWHGWLSVVALALTVVGLAPWLRVRDRAVCSLVGVWATICVLTLATGGLTALEPSSLTLTLSLAALVPPVWLSLLDLRAPSSNRATFAQPSALSDFVVCSAAALLVSGTHSLFTNTPGSIQPGGFAEIGRNVLLHLVVFSALFAAVSVIRGISRLAPDPEGAEAWLARIALAAVLGVFIHRVILASLSYQGDTAVGVAAAFGGSLALVFGPRGTDADRGVEAAVSGLVPRWATGSFMSAIAWVVLVMAAVGTAERAISGADWNFTVGKTLALCSWLLAFAAALRIAGMWEGAPVRRGLTTLAPFAAGLLVLGVQQYASAKGQAVPDADGDAASEDVSSRLIQDALQPAAPIETGVYEYLQQHTNIPRSVQIEPTSVDFAALTTPSGRRPQIFLFVIDSLRRDYLSPYNANVTFTPSVARFASDSTVFERAFTRYGGTGLAVPSIWVGGLLLHKQYVTPFAPMNTLAKLLAAEGYAQWLTMEHIVETIVPASDAIEPLDRGLPVKDHRFCGTLQDVRGRLDRLATADRPAFVYSLPQDVHVSTIAREGSRAIDGQDYAGFNPAYASRVRRFDACFGEFVEDLKARGMYEDSIIVLTSDHGDSLGEQGRMGHAYTVFPEVMQVPLIVHVPSALKSKFSAQPSALAFTSDVTPSLYALLGHTPIAPSSLFGRPLFYDAASAPAARPSAEVVASSYGSVYGALLDNGRRMYIVDAVSLTEHAYDLDGTAAGRPSSVRGSDRTAGQSAIRAAIEEISRFYGGATTNTADGSSARRYVTPALPHPRNVEAPSSTSAIHW